MSTDDQTNSSARRWRNVLVHETFEYLFNFAFLAVFLVAFAWYRRLLLASYHIQYTAYWAPLIEAAILAKVIMVGDVLRIGRSIRNRPLAVTTIYRTFVFSALVVLFLVLEHVVEALFHQKTVADGFAEFANKGIDEMLAWYVLIIAAFLPFFAMKEIERAFGADKVRAMFFRGCVDDAKSSVPDKNSIRTPS